MSSWALSVSRRSATGRLNVGETTIWYNNDMHGKKSLGKMVTVAVFVAAVNVGMSEQNVVAAAGHDTQLENAIKLAQGAACTIFPKP